MVVCCNVSVAEGLDGGPRAGGRRRRGASPGWRMGEPFLRGGAPDNTEEGAADQNYPG